MVNTFYKTLSIYEKKIFDPEMIWFLCELWEEI